MLTPEMLVQVQSIYQQKNSLLRFRVLRLQRELREARENLSGMLCAMDDQRMNLLRLRHELTHGGPGSASDAVRLNGRISATRLRLVELDSACTDLRLTIANLEEAIPDCRRQEARNNIRCDALADWVTPPQEETA